MLATPAAGRFHEQNRSDRLCGGTRSRFFSGDDPSSAVCLRSAFGNRNRYSGACRSPGKRRNGQRGGEPRFVEEQGTPVASLVTLRDAETRAQLENQIDTAAKLHAAIGRLTAGVAHEVRRILSTP